MLLPSGESDCLAHTAGQWLLEMLLRHADDITASAPDIQNSSLSGDRHGTEDAVQRAGATHPASSTGKDTMKERRCCVARHPVGWWYSVSPVTTELFLEQCLVSGKLFQ